MMKSWPAIPCIAMLAAPLAWCAPPAAPVIELKGVLAAGTASASLALVSVDRQPARLLALHAQVAAGVRLAAVSAYDATLSDGRVLRLMPGPPQAAVQAGRGAPKAVRAEVTLRVPDQRADGVERVHASLVE